MSLLTLKPTPASALPAPNSPDYTHYRDSLVHQALALVASLPTSPLWTPRKTYHAHHGLATHTYSTSTTQTPPPGSGDCEGYRWHARVSRHDPTRTSFDHFERGLLLNHSDNERDYIESCYTAQRLAVVTEGELEGASTSSRPGRVLAAPMLEGLTASPSLSQSGRQSARSPPPPPPPLSS